MKMSVKFGCCVACCVVLIVSGCAKTKTATIGGVVQQTKLVDGVYEGNYKGGLNSAIVNVTITDQKIVKIDIVKHSAWKGKKAEPIIPQRIIEQQSTTVDAVSGATNSSIVIMNAVQVALEKAYRHE